MLKLNQLRLEFADRVLFNDIDIFFGEEHKVGLVGKNGAGKSTLLKIIMGLQKPTGGMVIKPKDFTIGYLPQDLDFESDLSVKDEVMTAFEITQSLDRRIEEISHQLTVRTDYESDSYMDLAEELNHVSVQLGLYDVDHQEEQVERVLLGLGFTREDFTRPMNTFSGGWKMRMALAKILLQRPNLVLLDEPTNHLDIDSVEWLETYLKNYSGGVILISHDRYFLDRVTNRTVEIINGKTFDYPAAYSKFVELRTDVIQKQIDAKKNQDKEIKQTELLINKFRAKASKASFAQSLMKKLDKMELVEIDEEDESSMHFRFPPAPRSGLVVVKAEGLSKSYGEKKVLNNLDFEIVRGDHVALVGKNGVGKTTLTKIIAGLIPYDGKCELGTQVDLGYYSQNQSEELPVKATVLDVIDDEATGEMRTRIRSLLGAFMFQGDDVYKQVSVLSGGEKARLALCKMLLHKYNVLLLDEPTNHLDMRSKDVLKAALKKFDGTMLVVSHDREFLHGLTSKVMEIKDGVMSVFPGDITEFLAQKKAASIREFERVRVEKVVKAKPKPAVSEKEKWVLSKKVGTLEKEIETLEGKISGQKEESEKLDFSDHAKIKLHMEKLNEMEAKLLEKMSSWEKLSDKLNAV
ncbi:ABC-F family ATP-binding cassette domain-containing protein [Cryomorpha ignava]|uniref:Probable ATP-binding protein YbiT n=1 Tax=Cryomorpha ignava TaxID=101383 RepID=A0A7K3WPQ0_9FLAO|nr:ABC-F family ATP-binding cassette domain-containing protein [Cryomorpha ignava]NEN23011.1 ABC-F family ATP-binding cassette domain-containing protein [Cryomorpha ignava]